MTAVHVPAWKRLGLELVNSSAPEHDAAPVPKKRKIISSEATSNVNHGTTSKEKMRDEFHAAVPSELKKRERKISVTEATVEKLDPIVNKRQVEEEDEASKEAKRKRKHEAREIRRNKESELHAKDKRPKGSDEDKTPSSKSYLSYLYLYHVDRPQWKFNKSTQSSLLKDCFNLYRIPPEYGPALMQYISGLQGHAARARLAADARRTIDEAEKAIADGFTSLKAMDPMNLSEEHVHIPPPADLSPEKADDWKSFMEWRQGIYKEWNTKEAAIAADPEKAMAEYSNRRDFMGYMKRQQMLEDESRKGTVKYKFEMLKKRRGEEILNAVKIMMNAMVTEERERKQQALVASGRPPKPQNDPLAPKIINKPKKSRGRKRRTAAADDESSSESSSSSDSGDE